MAYWELITFWIALFFSVPFLVSAAHLRNYCEAAGNSRKTDNLISSVIAQMKLNAGGSLTCICIISGEQMDEFETGKTVTRKAR